ncbi:7452_t:CDS:1 [Paraglomus brasilianum]|uniref:7452_t:CDS:1 n=1 Tax=Paraglomus brasilianum TaxID=144538 RepID=A0A9N9C1A5_9GLOM|nr:7452_t:CDS:1 [Paraglomus brasilianum]
MNCESLPGGRGGGIIAKTACYTPCHFINMSTKSPGNCPRLIVDALLISAFFYIPLRLHGAPVPGVPLCCRVAGCIADMPCADAVPSYHKGLVCSVGIFLLRFDPQFILESVSPLMFCERRESCRDREYPRCRWYEHSRDASNLE